MPYVDIYPRRALSPTQAWRDPEFAAIPDDDTWASLPQGESGTLIFQDFDPKPLPYDVAVQGIEIFIRASVSATGSSALSARVSVSGIFNPNVPQSPIKSLQSQDLVTAPLSSVPSTLSVGGSSNVLGLPSPKRSWFDLPVEQNGNNTFRVQLHGTNNLAEYRVYSLFVRVHYTVSAYLSGSRSRFPQWIDRFPVAQNGTGPRNQVRSHDVNALGDAMVSLESTILDLQDGVYGFGSISGGKIVVSTCTVTGLVSSPSPGFFFLRGSVPSSPVQVSSNLADRGMVVPTVAPASFYFTQMAGWIDTGSGIEPVAVSPTLFRVVGHQNSRFYEIGFVVLPDTVADSFSRNVGNSYQAITMVPGTLPLGQLTVKIISLGRTS